MRLVAFLKAGPTSHHHGMWRHPETDNGFLDPAWYEQLAQTLERGFFDCLFFADVMGLYDYYNGNFNTFVSKGGALSLLDPIPILAMMSRVTKHIGLGATLSTTFVNPYQIARVLGTLDVLSGGRMAWNVVTSASSTEARNFGLEAMPGRSERYEKAHEVVDACMHLWDSWQDGALVMDKENGIFADPSKVRYVDYKGKWVKTRGPLTVPRSPQGHPVIMQAGSSGPGRAFAARWAEMIFTLQHSTREMVAFRAEMREALAAAGRNPDDCAVLPSVDPIIGETESIAREKQAYVNSLVDPELGMSLMSSHVGSDLSKYTPDQSLLDLQLEEGSRGSLDVILQGTKAEGLTIGEAAKRFATSELAPQVVGTPEQVADQLEMMFTAGGCDGFILTPTVSPGTWEQFARSVVPILQKRGLMRTSYEGPTLRQNLR
ncbi:NtaA/DmoA family FMN-dependent monooxygenase [Agrobacterium vitis]|uniref:NtaA/DmoA family FMN-dependent monooxygenase n=2 Tax=Agrobacterium vitis TaxID=373 RepID=A0A1S2E9V3_AGRVI|nr:LLM class flavin-dependent oxidoreductase [Agrobacterium vitis]MUO68780.1 NtaA/DmoA family FMN-dependent monooxygenase [Agrobacterium vitis]MUO79805.1 NtaA/DmoA family FMN-dependent monooxygenase [Agrobacterium vitis]MUO93706.1 NtaA/DmoA family FMN-dependent monooxygenase [Agrobacterium vitis]MUP04043.1 NtaA/DmoA family FMN-dependent monooxygenase [Agrobacterium vitis]